MVMHIGMHIDNLSYFVEDIFTILKLKNYEYIGLN